LTSRGEIMVLQVVESLHVGGMERVAVDLALQKGEHGFRCGLAALLGDGALEAEVRAAEVPLEIMHKQGRFDWRVVRGLAAQASRLGADLIHAHNTVGMLYSVLAGLLARRPVVTTLHGSSYLMPPRLRRYRRWLSRGSRLVVCVSASAFRAALEVDRISPRRLRMVHNGIAIPDFETGPGPAEALRRELSLAPEDRLLFSLGRLSYEKDFATMFRAVGLLGQAGARAHLVVAGDGPDRGDLERLIAQQGLGGRIHLLGTRDDVPDLLAAAEIFVQSSMSEGLSIALLEAMAAGLPVAATAVGGNPEVVLPGETGLLVPPNDPSALAGAMSQLLGDPELCRRLGRAGAGRVREHFSLDAMARAYAGLYREVLG
jgi:glycosyltransferase involved in cell wall biosynthesis